MKNTVVNEIPQSIVRLLANLPVKLLTGLVLVISLGLAGLAVANETPKTEQLSATVLVLDFELNDLTMHPDTVREEKRVKTLEPLLSGKLDSVYHHDVLRMSRAELEKEAHGKGYIFERPAVAARLGKQAGADWVVTGRLHKASFLFVYLKSQLIEVSSGEIRADFVVEIKGWEPRLTEKGVDALALQVHESLQALLAKNK